MGYETNPSPRGAESVLAEKWGLEIIGQGYTAVPDVLLARMGELKLTPTEMVLILQLLRFWWAAGQWPFPSKRTLAQAMGMSEKNVQKVMGRLVRGGLVRRIERKKASDRNDSNCYDLEPLIARLLPLARQARQGRAGAAHLSADNRIPPDSYFDRAPRRGSRPRNRNSSTPYDPDAPLRPAVERI